MLGHWIWEDSHPSPEHYCILSSQGCEYSAHSYVLCPIHDPQYDVGDFFFISLKIISMLTPGVSLHFLHYYLFLVDFLEFPTCSALDSGGYSDYATHYSKLRSQRCEYSGHPYVSPIHDPNMTSVNFPIF